MTCPTLLSAWLLEYPVGYHVRCGCKDMGNCLSDKPLSLYTLSAQVCGETIGAVNRHWVPTAISECEGDCISPVYSFSVPADLESTSVLTESLCHWRVQMSKRLSDKDCTGSLRLWHSPQTCNSETSDESNLCKWESRLSVHLSRVAL